MNGYPNSRFDDNISNFSSEPYVVAPHLTHLEESLIFFFGYKTEFFSFQNNAKNLDPSFKPDLDHCECLRRVKLVNI